MARIKVATALFVLALSGCTTVTGTGEPPAELARKIVYGTQATIGGCPSADGEAGILGVIGASVIAKGVNRIGAVIKAAAKEETTTVLARRNVELSNSSPLGPCLLVARGWFFQDRLVASDEAYRENTDLKFAYESSRSFIHRQGLLLAGTPDFFFEGKLVASADNSAMSVTPAYALMGRPISENLFRPSSERSLLISFAFAKPSKAVDLTKGQGAAIVLGRFRSGESKEFTTDSARLVSCVPGPAAPCQTIRGAQESEWFSVPLNEKAEPMTLQVLVSETRSASEFLEFVGEVFSDVEKDLTSDLQKALIPSVREAAEETAQGANEKAASEFDSEYSKALLALSSCVDNPTDLAKIAAAKVAMRTANQKARLAGESTLPFDESEIDNIPLKHGAVAGAACTAALGP